MENRTIEGDSPVFETADRLEYPIMRARKSCMNPARPWAKPKYKNLRKWTSTVKEIEKNPGEGSEIEPEIISLQAVEPYACLRAENGDCVPFA